MFRATFNLLNLSTVLGLIVAVIAGTTLLPGPDRLMLAMNYRWPWPSGGCITLGNVVLVRPGVRLSSALLTHESRHATQWALCLGLPFLPLYGLAVLWSLYRYGDTANGNIFERAAGLTDGGYRRRAPVRP
ncbi:MULTISPECIES: hypothetical protein [Auritidibacter]|uniref:hypothetical protein n=1 Tax=Auritidibacter TaxID=1160973 RepID=UPI000D729C9F|nr:MULTISPECIES: hypothetical protein [Auritidibacter]PXA80024.1 hypothetical protein DCC26_04550 [Auritidibacter sp. NML120779]AXR73755.1 hypothetical protein DCC27_004950 [Auritidibacter sp. NML130574]NIH72350.1 hypothetical protein [Auritidibacter ignavus]PXA78814.1 hypothetical protein DCC25_10870 [Auritidibacter sp. NML120636]RMX21935.1 hypothetical protein DYI20_10720 [Auritidibacter ignavus]